MVPLDDLHVELFAQNFRSLLYQLLQKVDAHGEVRRLEEGNFLRRLVDLRKLRVGVPRRREDDRRTRALCIGEHVAEVRRAGKIDHRVRLFRLVEPRMYGNAAQFALRKVDAAHALRVRILVYKFEYVPAHMPQDTADQNFNHIAPLCRVFRGRIVNFAPKAPDFIAESRARICPAP